MWKKFICFFSGHDFKPYWKDGKKWRKCVKCDKTERKIIKFTARGNIEEWI